MPLVPSKTWRAGEVQGSENMEVVRKETEIKAWGLSKDVNNGSSHRIPDGGMGMNSTWTTALLPEISRTCPRFISPFPRRSVTISAYFGNCPFVLYHHDFKN
jgi:hypothetical protein